MKRRQQFNPNKPETVPPNVAGIDWRSLRKGDVITSEQILDMFNIIWDEREVCPSSAMLTQELHADASQRLA